jgi:hypothetical protein
VDDKGLRIALACLVLGSLVLTRSLTESRTRRLRRETGVQDDQGTVVPGGHRDMSSLQQFWHVAGFVIVAIAVAMVALGLSLILLGWPHWFEAP